MISYDANFSKLKLNVGGNCDLNTVRVPSYSGGIPPNATNELRKYQITVLLLTESLGGRVTIRSSCASDNLPKPRNREFSVSKSDYKK